VTREAMTMLMQRIKGQVVKPEQRFVKPRIVEGHTLGPIPAMVIAGK